MIDLAVYHAEMPLTQKMLAKVGRRIRQFRTEKKLSQEQLAEIASLSATYVGRLERGEKQSSLETLVRLAECLDVSTIDLLLDLEPKLSRSLIRSRIKKLVDLL